MEDRFLPNFAWAVHEAYRKVIPRAAFQAGDMLYSSIKAWERGQLTAGEAAIQIRKVEGSGQNARLDIDLYVDSWKQPKPLRVAAAALIAYLRTDDMTELKPCN